MLGILRVPSHLRPKKRRMMAYQNENEMPQQHCLHCGDAIGYGRTDRKFCSPECKNAWHNTHRNPDRGRSETRVLLLLENNYSILRRLLVMGVRSIDCRTLRQLGFLPEYATRFYKRGRRNLYELFDISYESTPSRLRKIAFTDGEGVDNGQ